MIKVCAIVVTYNRRNYLERCIHSLMTQTQGVDKIFIIDNCSTDDTQEFIENLKSEKVIYRRLDNNLGGAGGFEFGLRLAHKEGYDWYWLMDDDTEPMVSCLANFQVFMDENPLISDHYGALCPLILNDENKVNMSSWTSLYKQEHLYFGREIPQPQKFLESHTIIGSYGFAGILVSQKSVNLVGFPKGGMFIYGDDTDYTLRISQKKPIITVPAALVKHPDVVVRTRQWTFFGKTFYEHEYADYWRVYYEIRNSCYLYSQYISRIASIQYAISETISPKIILKIIISGKTIDKMRIRLQAVLDAFRLQLVHRYTPAHFRKS